jgi:hypothetical protein
MCPKCGHFIGENYYIKFISEEVGQLLQERNEYYNCRAQEREAPD